VSQPERPIPAGIDLADAQLRAYNRRDIDAFAACFHPNVRVIDEDGAVTMEGIETFRERYGAMFAEHIIVAASIVGRVALPPHVVELETWFRQKVRDGPVSSGQVIVRYTERDGLLAVVEFLRPTA